MDQFLAGIERRALVMAELATHNREDALDLVQDAMMAFVTHYENHLQKEWPPLFYRVLQNRIRDWHRQQKSRGRWWQLLSGRKTDNEHSEDPIQTIADPSELPPEKILMNLQSAESILHAVRQLPLRQQQAFLLRSWEGLSVEETATAMGCSAGSVKTHRSRAMRALRESLQEQKR